MAHGKVVRWTFMVLLAGVRVPWSHGQGTDSPSPGGPTTISLIAVDTEVVLRARETVVKVEKRVVATGEVHRVYRVERVSGDWLWVTADGQGGWARATDVLPLEQAVAHYTEEIRKQPKDPWPYLMRGMIWYDRRDYDKAIADYDAAIERDARNAVSYHNRGDARLAKKEYGKAIADYNDATRLDPASAASYTNRGFARAAEHDLDLAIADYNEAIRLDPKDVAKYHQRAEAWTAKHEYEQALADYQRAIQLDPNDAFAYNGQGWVLATAPDTQVRDGRKAVESATRACELTRWDDPYCIGTLAAAEAEAGRFDEAVKWQEKAVALFAKNTPDDQSHHRRLALYQAKKPYRDEVPSR